jgi:hypothetical protein
VSGMSGLAKGLQRWFTCRTGKFLSLTGIKSDAPAVNAAFQSLAGGVPDLERDSFDRGRTGHLGPGLHADSMGPGLGSWQARPAPVSALFR